MVKKKIYLCYFDLVPGMLNQHLEKYLLSVRKITKFFEKRQKLHNFTLIENILTLEISLFDC